jgi:hypothetical protein
MARIEFPDSAVAYPGTVEIILRAARLGLFTPAEAELLIAKARTHTTSPPLSIHDSNPTAGIGHARTRPHCPNRTVR